MDNAFIKLASERRRDDKIMEEGISYVLPQVSLDYGFVRLIKKAQQHFPQTDETIKIGVYFDDSSEEVELSYSGKWMNIYGLTGWFKEHRAIAGDKIIIQPLGEKKYRLKFVKVKEEKAPVVEPRFREVPHLFVGTPINFRGIVYAPLNEAGVVLLFSKIMKDLGIVYEASPSVFPDAIIRRATSKGWELKFVEFEFKSSNFIHHKHDETKCDIIVCWEHDWKECPLEVIELKKLIKELPPE